MSLRVTSPVKEKGADVDGVDRYETEREGGAADLDCLDLNYTLLRLMVTASMAYM